MARAAATSLNQQVQIPDCSDVWNRVLSSLPYKVTTDSCVSSFFLSDSARLRGEIRSSNRSPRQIVGSVRHNTHDRPFYLDEQCSLCEVLLVDEVKWLAWLFNDSNSITSI